MNVARSIPCFRRICWNASTYMRFGSTRVPQRNLDTLLTSWTKHSIPACLLSQTYCFTNPYVSVGARSINVATVRKSKMQKYHKTSPNPGPIEPLPEIAALSDGTKISIDYLKETDLIHVYSMFKGAADAGDGYAHEEFSDIEVFKKMVSRDHYFSMVDVTNGVIIGVFSVHSTRLTRSSKAVFAAGNAVIDHRYRNKNCHFVMTLLHAKFSHFLGYQGLLFETFETNKAILRNAEKVDAKLIGYIPNSAYFPSHGWVNSIMMYSAFGNKSHPDDSKYALSMDQIEQMGLNKTLAPRGCLEPWTNTISSLPRRFTVKDGREFTARYVDKTEYFEVFNMIKDAADNGVGFGIDEFPTFEYFMDSMSRGHIFCITENTSNDIVGMFTCIPSKYSRTQMSQFAAGPSIMKHGYRGIGIYGNIRDMSEDLAKELGYQGILGDMLEINQPIIDSYERYGYKLVAKIPRSSFVKGKGWVAAVAFYKPFSSDGKHDTRPTSKL
ncbi:unnamed protein product [Owenia fusiformis]|uniref:Uncharacterized protein n=1 Tax=Owenia fusiformis TaxID=6347 RepID=A0A8J1TTH3_OWEFU|nr:unnamed protein product [Owenia fusiformis]